MRIIIDPEVTKLFPELRLFATKPLGKAGKVLDTAFAEHHKLLETERTAYIAFRKQREMLAKSHFLLAVETYLNYESSGATLESLVRQVSAITGIPLGIVPTKVLKKHLQLRFSRPDEQLAVNENKTVELPANSLVLCNKTTILGHFSVQGSRHLVPQIDDSVCVISYVPSKKVPTHKITSCLRALENQLAV